MDADTARQQLPAALLAADAYPHECSAVRLIETHMSWLFLTGDYAYKVKKPIHFDTRRIAMSYQAHHIETAVEAKPADQVSPEAEVLTVDFRRRESLSQNYRDEIDAWARHALASNGFGDF